MKLYERCLIHAQKMQDEGFYVTANVLYEAAQKLQDKIPIKPGEKREKVTKYVPDFSKFKPIRSEKQCYDDGRETGMNWKYDYIPGGPFVCGDAGLLSNDPNWKAYCEQSKINHNQWMRGFKDGLMEDQIEKYRTLYKK